LWLGTGAGIEHFDPASGERREILRLSQAPRINRAGMPRAIDFQFDSTGMLWAATDGGLFRIDPRSRSYQRIGDETPAYGMFLDAEKRLWTGRLDGLWRIHDSGRIEQATDSTGRPVDAVWRIAGDPHGQLWLALLDGG